MVNVPVVYGTVNFIVDKYYNIKNLNFLADKNKIYLSNAKLNKNFEVKDLNQLEVITFINEIKNNSVPVEQLPQHAIIV